MLTILISPKLPSLGLTSVTNLFFYKIPFLENFIIIAFSRHTQREFPGSELPMAYTLAEQNQPVMQIGFSSE